MDNQLTHPASLAELVDYQPGSVVSRVLFRNPGGTMTVFAFAEGQGLSEHSNPNDAVILVLDGSVAVTIGDQEHEVETGECLHLPADVPHALPGGEPLKMLLTLLRT